MTCLCRIKAPDGIFCLFEKLYHVLQRLSVVVVCQVLYVFSTLCEVMVQLLLQIFVQASCHGRFESGPGLTRVRPGFDAGQTHCKPGLDLGLACALAFLRYDANMNQKGSLLFCAFNGCPQELDFKKGWRKACHSKGKFYGALKHNCGTPNGEVSCGYVSKDLATEHKFRIVDKDSVEGKKLAGVEQTLYGFQKTQRLGRSEATSALNEVVNMCLASTQTKRQSMCQRSRCFPA